MSEELQITVSAFRHAVATLQKAGLVTVQGSPKGQIITVHTDLHLKERESKPEDKFIITDALPVLRQNSDKLEQVLEVKHGTLHIFFQPFAEMQYLRGHSWTTIRDLLSHFTSWYMKMEKTDFAKRRKSNSTSIQRTESNEVQIASIMTTRATVKEEWIKSIVAARKRGNEEDLAFLADPRTTAAINRYNL